MFPMKTLLLLFVFSASLARAQDGAGRRQEMMKLAERAGVEIRLDQPYAGNTNPRQMLDVYLPKKRNTGKPLPVVAFIHGGGWISGDRHVYAGRAIDFAGTGDYVAISVGYRLTNEAHWPEQIYDCKAAIRWIRGHAADLNLDPDRIGVTGMSAGGHLSSLLGTSGMVRELEGSIGPFTTLSSRVACVVNLCGPEDFTKALMSDPQGNPLVNDDAVTGLLGGTFEQKHAEAVAASPVTYVSKDDPPFLTIHGTADQRVFFSNAEAIHSALRNVGVPTLLVPVTDGRHASADNPETWKRSKAFFDLYLRGIQGVIDTAPIPAPPEKKKP